MKNKTNTFQPKQNCVDTYHTACILKDNNKINFKNMWELSNKYSGFF